jgi:hypothetical protein
MKNKNVVTAAAMLVATGIWFSIIYNRPSRKCHFLHEIPNYEDHRLATAD